MGLAYIASGVEARHADAFPADGNDPRPDAPLGVGGEYQ